MCINTGINYRRDDLLGEVDEILPNLYNLEGWEELASLDPEEILAPISPDREDLLAPELPTDQEKTNQEDPIYLGPDPIVNPTKQKFKKWTIRKPLNSNIKKKKSPGPYISMNSLTSCLFCDNNSIKLILNPNTFLEEGNCSNCGLSLLVLPSNIKKYL